jgi:hypothetical protein
MHRFNDGIRDGLGRLGDVLGQPAKVSGAALAAAR